MSGGKPTLQFSASAILSLDSFAPTLFKERFLVSRWIKPDLYLYFYCSLPCITMASDKNGAANGGSTDFTVKAGLAQMLKGGVIMDVVNAEQVCPFI